MMHDGIPAPVMNVNGDDGLEFEGDGSALDNEEEFEDDLCTDSIPSDHAHVSVFTLKCTVQVIIQFV